MNRERHYRVTAANDHRLALANAEITRLHRVLRERDSEIPKEYEEQAQAWRAVYDQLCHPHRDFQNRSLSPNCGMNEAIRKVKELQSKAAAYDAAVKALEI